ncbi:MAG TPA: hypothetical protein VND65_18615 [Candidatus Binatia bacterium]|nr:hypothetical protein [Candidatus Binatia bacterium]
MLSANNNRRTSLGGKSPAVLSEGLCQRLHSYALAAGAAGVSVLACAPAATASPVCKSLSDELVHTNYLPLYLGGATVPVFNVAQATNTTFVSFSTTGLGVLFWWNRAFFTPNSAGAKIALADNLPADLASGAEIGPGGNFGKGGSYGLLFTYGKGRFGSGHGGGTMQKHRGNLSLTQESLVGFRFTQSGQVHYGWARMNVSFQNGHYPKGKHTVVHILGYGYETAPNTGIAAGSCGSEEQASGGPKTSSSDASERTLGRLALGSDGMARLREPMF